MTKPFLEEIADYVFEQYGDQTGDICLVTPNRRAGLFFRKYFSQRVVKPVWAPEVLSIEDFINRISGMKVCDSTSILFTFFELYCDLEKDKAQDIDEFSLWAPVLLNDFDEIDANIADTESLFDYLHDVKRIETWNPDGAPLTDFQKKYLAFFSRLKAWHRHLTEHLITANQAYQGLSSKQATKKVESDSYKLPWQKALFVGFNALNHSEELIISTLLRKGQAVYLPDSDPYYTDDTDHEAGLFIRKYQKKFGHTINKDNTFITGLKKQITILGIAKNVNQARLAGNILQQRKELKPNIDTAIVLANEQLLIPTLNALPHDAESINVTMGYPLNKTNIFGFFDALWKLQLNATITEKENSTSEICFYHKDLIRFLNHSICSLLWDGEGAEKLITSVIQQIKQSNKAFLGVEEFFAFFEKTEGIPDPLSCLQFNWSNNKAGIFPSLLNIVGRLDQAFRDKAAKQGKDILHTPYFIDFEALYFFSTLLRRLNSFLLRYPFLQSLQTIYKLYKQLTQETSLAFSGEPLQGMQVMGMLETRSLDFKNIILLSANENILPRPKTNNSFLPFDIRKKFGMQVHTDKDAIYAYHFYRLLQRAQNIYLIYNTQSEDIGTNEKSRFITQLQMELPGRAPHITITEQIIALPPPAMVMQHDFRVFKDKDISDRLIAMSQNGLSPSALNTYINCSLQFYFTRVARLEEPQGMEETLESATMGTVVHGILETLYRPLTGKHLEAHNIETMRKQTDDVTRRIFEAHYPGGNVSSGKNLLLFNLAKRYTSNFLNAESAYLKTINGHSIKVLALEEELEGTIDVLINGSPVKVKIRGKADRIDQVGPTIRVIDYKTGKIKRNELKFPDWAQVSTDGQFGKAFQLLSYAWLYSRKYPKATQIEPGIYSLRETKKGLQTLTIPDGDSILNPGNLDMFTEQLSALIQAILDNQIPFGQTANENNCTYCPFKVYCRRF